MKIRANIVRIDVEKELAKPYDERARAEYRRLFEVAAENRLLSEHQAKARFGVWFSKAVKSGRLKGINTDPHNLKSPVRFPLSSIYALIKSDEDRKYDLSLILRSTNK